MATKNTYSWDANGNMMQRTISGGSQAVNCFNIDKPHGEI